MVTRVVSLNECNFSFHKVSKNCTLLLLTNRGYDVMITRLRGYDCYPWICNGENELIAWSWHCDKRNIGKDCGTRGIVTPARQNKHLRARSFEDLFRNSWRRETSVKGQLAQTGSANRHETIFYFRPGARVESQTNDRWIWPLASWSWK